MTKKQNDSKSLRKESFAVSYMNQDAGTITIIGSEIRTTMPPHLEAIALKEWDDLRRNGVKDLGEIRLLEAVPVPEDFLVPELWKRLTEQGFVLKGE